ncbi:unnamed protein product [Didymodactylos carnosus]|uniref:polynucleotide adenylyltransferase n=1 Tax=Didymodactylos carnosus TaxID=1234261 RepID=A0A813YC32_9BILA|nr:unnamed protein product [Didymodactylos carnosus]CAF3668120.1 unnamed protein product [Didymodactylos carnosus]
MRQHQSHHQQQVQHSTIEQIHSSISKNLRRPLSTSRIVDLQQHQEHSPQATLTLSNEHQNETFRGIELDSSILSVCQVKRLLQLLDQPILINSHTTLPTLTVTPSLFLTQLRLEARQHGLFLRDLRLSGGAASFVLDSTGDLAFRDLDFLISVPDVSSEASWSNIKQAVFSSLPNLHSTASFTHHYQQTQLSLPKRTCTELIEAYTDKMIRILNNYDRWGLISLRNTDGRNLEVKFVERMKRQYQFSVDSFQIVLDPLLNFIDSNQKQSTKLFSNNSMSHKTKHHLKNFHEALTTLSMIGQATSVCPTIVALSNYGNFHVALNHLHHRLIAVKAPEELRGGGLLKYCDLVARGFQPAEPTLIYDLQRYMCSRFFIDFRDSSTQEQVLSKYVGSHFGTDYSVRYRFLYCLYEVISNDSVWLSGYERTCFLHAISTMATTAMAKSCFDYHQQHHSLIPFATSQTGTIKIKKIPHCCMTLSC